MTRLRMLLNSYYSGANAWFALAEARGYFADEGLAMEFTAGNGAYRAPRMLVEGGYDMTLGDMGSLTRMAAEGPAPIAIYAVHHRGPSAIAVPAESPIHTPADLAGRHLIGHLSDVALRTFPAYAEAAGIDADQTSIAISDDTMAEMLVTMFKDEAVDGVFGYISSMRAVLRQSDPALAAGLRFLPFPEVAPDLYGSVIIASREAVAAKGNALRAFLRAMQRALVAAVTDVPAAIAAVLERNPALDRTIELDRWQGTIEDEFDHAETATIGFGAIDPERLARSAAALARTVPLKRAPSAADLYDPRFLPPLAGRLELAAACRSASYEAI